MFECKLKRAYEACGCIPWNYPHFVDKKAEGLTDLCDYVGNSCFEQKMDEFVDKVIECSCLSDCNRISYSVSISIQKLLSDDHCNSNDRGMPLNPRSCRLRVKPYLQTRTNLGTRYTHGFTTNDSASLANLWSSS